MTTWSVGLGRPEGDQPGRPVARVYVDEITGKTYASQEEAPRPMPPTRYLPLPGPDDVRDRLRWPTLDDDQHLQADQHVEQATALVRAYVRGRGFVEVDGVQQVAEGLRAVIVGAAARSLHNPTGSTRIEVGTYSEVLGLPDWTLGERLILDGFRRRAA